MRVERRDAGLLRRCPALASRDGPHGTPSSGTGIIPAHIVLVQISRLVQPFPAAHSPVAASLGTTQTIHLGSADHPSIRGSSASRDAVPRGDNERCPALHLYIVYGEAIRQVNRAHSHCSGILLNYSSRCI